MACPWILKYRMFVRGRSTRSTQTGERRKVEILRVCIQDIYAILHSTYSVLIN